ncbi:nephronectin-like [Scleropages formosus]|uniref:Nephronectin-like n=1 Tax=Scleropages formosus TaxID=113540 RepID=A0A0N8JY22_SCLFO|nr:nephronectin-like [Scleropages formosus]
MPTKKYKRLEEVKDWFQKGCNGTADLAGSCSLVALGFKSCLGLLVTYWPPVLECTLRLAHGPSPGGATHYSIGSASDTRWPRQMVSSTGLCRYGARIDCCWGWTRRSWGHCQPLCQHGCKYGECIGPNKCRCFPGYTGKACNQDLNECGLKPRPCKHRCMNTYGSYKCYCLSGYMMMPDGTCGNAHTCALANCQYGCGVVKGEVRCQCPSPGLQLGSDGRTCVDVDECSLGRAMCPRFRKCINTFGSYVCRCHEGFELRYISGKYHCADVNECSSGQHRCAGFATCHNTPGSYKCKCANGFGTPGSSCKTIPKVIIDPPRPGNVTNNTVPRNHGHNNVFDFDIELGNTAEELRDDSDAGFLSCAFDNGLCGWIRDREGDLHWETITDPSGGKYLTIPEVVGKKRGRGACLVLPLTKPWNSGNICLSFRHKLEGHHVGMLQVFVGKGKQNSPAVWGRTGGKGWRSTQITLWASGLESVMLKGDRGRGRSGEIAIDDISLRTGPCTDDHGLRRL